MSRARFGLVALVRRSLRQHAVSSVVTVGSIGLATGLAMAVFAIHRQTYDAFTGGEAGFDAVLGGRGSQLQLVLNSVFHLETSPGNIPWSMYVDMATHPRVALAVPIAVGDNYEGYRIVGTSEEMFTRFRYRSGRGLVMAPGGRVFRPDQPEAVVGNYVARRLNLGVGATFAPRHGVSSGEREHREQYTVVGVLEPTNSPSDRVIWIPLEGVLRMSGHVLRGGGREYRPQEGVPIPDEHREVSAVLLKFTTPQAGFTLSQQINRQGKTATLAWPIGRVMAELFERIGWVSRVLGMVAYLVLAVAVGSVLASIYNTMNERRREFAILRALGARRVTISGVIVLEATTISALGVAVGFLVYGGILAAAIAAVRAQTGVVLDALRWNQALALVPAATILAGALAGVAPAIKAYQTDVASNLSPLS